MLTPEPVTAVRRGLLRAEVNALLPMGTQSCATTHACKGILSASVRSCHLCRAALSRDAAVLGLGCSLFERLAAQQAQHWDVPASHCRAEDLCQVASRDDLAVGDFFSLDSSGAGRLGYESCRAHFPFTLILVGLMSK